MGKKSAVMIAIDKFKKNISKKIPLSKLILFGSYARGDQKKDSDVDLILVSSKFSRKSLAKRSWSLYKYWHLDDKINYPVDFLCFTPLEFKKLSKGVTIVSHAIKEGIDLTN